jgi:hypothetical protein
MASDDIQASLAPPGAGLPRFQAFMLRYVLFPTYCRFTSWDTAAAVFEAEGKKLIELARPLPPLLFQKRVLLKPLWGIEDSSRYWSAEMVLEHLIEMGTCIATRVVDLTNGETPPCEVNVADFKPRGGRGPQVLEDYTRFLDDYAKTLLEDVGEKRSKLTHPHPWFGQLTAHRWVCLGTIHQAIHRRQIARIVATLHA